MAAAYLKPVPIRWVCPNCNATKVTTIAAPHTPFHPCPGVRGLTAPFVREGVRCKVEAQERQDYTHGDLVTLDEDGRAVMSLVTTRDDGTDCTVFAPCIRVTVQ